MSRRILKSIKRVFTVNTNALEYNFNFYLIDEKVIIVFIKRLNELKNISIVATKKI